MNWYRTEVTITYRRDIQASSKAEAEAELLEDWCDDDMEGAEAEADEITQEER